MKAIARRQTTVSTIFSKVRLCRKYATGLDGAIAPISRAYDDLMNYSFSKLYDMGNGVYKVTTFRNTWYELDTNEPTPEETEYQAYSDCLAAQSDADTLVVEVVVLQYAEQQESEEEMSKFEAGDKVRWDDVMGHSEEGIIIETQFHHYVIGRMVDGELVAHGYVRFDEPTLRKQEEPAQVAYPLTSETMYGTPNGGTTICNACGVPVGYDGLVPPVLCYRCSQTESTSKGEALAENLKHLGKPERRDNVCRSWVNGVAHLTDSFNYYRRTKATGGRNKAGGNFGRYDMRVERELDALIYDTRSSRFFEGDTVRTPRQSQAIRDGYCHWFPVALENTTYSDSLARHFSGGLQEGLRATESLLPRGDSWLYRKFNGRRYQDKLWVPREDWGNKAQVNRYHACKTY